MPFFIVREDITRMQVDAIVTAGEAGAVPDTTGGVNGRIHRKAGEGLLAAIMGKGGIKTGGASITEAFDLPCRYVIHTAGPQWQDGRHGEALLLASCYEESMRLAHSRGLSSIAFPLISTGRYGYPREEAVQVASRAIRNCLNSGMEMTAYLVVYDEEAFRISSGLFERVEQFIDEHYVEEHPARGEERPDMRMERLSVSVPEKELLAAYRAHSEQTEEAGRDAEAAKAFQEELERRRARIREARSAPREMASPCAAPRRKKRLFERAEREEACAMPAPARRAVPTAAELDEWLKHLDAGFAETLLALIDAKDMTDAQCYKKANVDKKVFSKIRSTPGYTPKKTTVVAFAIALELDMAATRDLLSRAGYGMSRSSKFDVIIEFFIARREYDVFRINEVLYDHDMPLLGSSVG